MSSAVRVLLVVAIVLAGLVAGSAWALHHVGMRLTFDDDVLVRIGRDVPFRLRLQQPLDVAIDDAVNARVKLDQLEIPLDEKIDVPIKLDLEVPIDSELAVKESIPIALTVPI